MSVAPDLIAGLRATVAAQVKVVLPELRSCEAIDGDFDARELDRVSRHSPAVLVATLGASQVQAPAWPRIELQLAMAAFIVTRNRGAVSGTFDNLVIAQRLFLLLPENDWGSPDFGPAKAISWRNAVSDATRGKQLVLSAVSWQQPVVLQADDLQQPIDMDLYISRAPEIGAAHVDDYTQVGT